MKPGGMSVKEAFGENAQASAGVMDTLAWLDSKDTYIEELERENAQLKEENADLYRKAYLTIKLPKWLRRSRRGEGPS